MQPRDSNKGECSMVNKFAFATIAAGWLCLTVILPIPAEAAVLQVSPSLVPTVESDFVKVHCYWGYNSQGNRKRFCGSPNYGNAPYYDCIVIIKEYGKRKCARVGYGPDFQRYRPYYQPSGYLNQPYVFYYPSYGYPYAYPYGFFYYGRNW